MSRFLSTMISCSVVMSVISLIYLGALPYLRKRYSAKWLYYIWLMVIIGWIMPFRPYIGSIFKASIMPKTQQLQGGYKIYNQQLCNLPSQSSSKLHISFMLIMIIIWAMIAVGVVGFQVWRHAQFLKIVKRWSNNVEDSELLHHLSQLRYEIGIKHNVAIKTCPTVASPMMIGFFRPTILMPSVKISYDELDFILRHELYHLKRNDLWYKAIVLLSTALHWFNPVIYYVGKSIEVQCEISCDELLVKRTDFKQRKRYGETLIGAIRKGNNLHTALSTDFYSKEKVIRTRLVHIMDTTKKSAALIVLCLIFILVLGSGTVYGSNILDNSKTTQIINVDVKSLKKGQLAYIDGPYVLKAGDVIKYDITSNNMQNMYVDFIKKDSIQEGTDIRYQPLRGYIMGYPNCQSTVYKGLEGEFCVLVKFADLDAGNNIKGKIEIVRGE